MSKEKLIDRFHKATKHLGSKRDMFTDGSSQWIALNKEGFVLEISFDTKGEKVTGIGIYTEVVEVVNQKTLIEF